MSSGTCLEQPPVISSPACGPTPKQGGADILLVAYCNIESDILDPTDASQWNAAFAAGNVSIMRGVSLNVPLPTPITNQLTPCGPPEVVNFDRVWNFMFKDTNTDHTDTFNDLNADSKSLYWSYVDCNGDWHGWAKQVTSAVGKLTPETDSDPIQWEGPISFRALAEIAPVVFPNVDF